MERVTVFATSRKMGTQTDCGISRQESPKEMVSKKRNPFQHSVKSTTPSQITSNCSIFVIDKLLFTPKLADFMLSTGTPSLVGKCFSQTDFALP